MTRFLHTNGAVLLVAFSLALIAFAATPQPQPGAIEQTGTSPRIEKLKRDVANHAPGAVEAFWTELAREHTPIVEPVPGDTARVLITLVWRGAADMTSVQGLGIDMAHVPSTDVWFTTFTMRRDHRLSYFFTPKPPPTAKAPARQHDPLNPHRFQPPVAAERPASSIDRESAFMGTSIVVLPDAPASPYVDPRKGVAPGKVEERTYASQVYGASRRIWIYTPPASRSPAGLLVCLWGSTYLNEIPVPTILDNLIADGKIPPMAAIFVDNGNDRFQDFPVTQRFADSFSRELIPWARANLHVPADPRRVIVTGWSASGLASTYVAFKHPDIVGNVLSSSGAFWRGFDGTGASEREYLASQFAASPVHETRFFLDVGGEETRAAGGTFKDATTRLRDVLVKKGYAVSYVEVPGGEHEFIHWRTMFADGLLYLTTGWSA